MQLQDVQATVTTLRGELATSTDENRRLLGQVNDMDQKALLEEKTSAASRGQLEAELTKVTPIYTQKKISTLNTGG